MPEWGFRFISFTDKGKEFFNSDNPPEQQQLIQEQKENQYPEPEDNPFEGATLPPSENQNKSFDIY